MVVVMIVVAVPMVVIMIVTLVSIYPIFGIKRKPGILGDLTQICNLFDPGFVPLIGIFFNRESNFFAGFINGNPPTLIDIGVGSKFRCPGNEIRQFSFDIGVRLVAFQMCQSIPYFATEITQRSWHVFGDLMMMCVTVGLVFFAGTPTAGNAKNANAGSKDQSSHHLYSGAGTSFMIRAITSSVASPCVINRTDKTG